jgi:O-antigen ligase
MTQGAPMTLWDKVRDNYTQVVLLIGVTAYLPFAYFTASAVTPLIFLIGFLLLGHLKSLRIFAPVAAATGIMLILAFLRSDFVDSLMHGKSFAQAAHDSKLYFRAPMITWFGIWALVCAAYDLGERHSARVVDYFGYIVLVLTVLLAAEALSHFGLRNWINQSFFKGARPEMVVVRVSDSNYLLLYLFWPLAFYFMRRGWAAAVGFMALVIAGLSVVVDTNAQLMALAVSSAVFFAVKYWPRGLWARRITPERTTAVLVGAFLLVFPFIVLAMARSGALARAAQHMGGSWGERLRIWTFAVEQASRKPIWGWGYESSRNFDPIIPEHPHSPSLQAWLELGIPGLIVLAVLWFLIFWGLAPKAGGAPVADDDAGLVELTAAPEPVAEDAFAQQARPYVLALTVTFFTVNAVSYGIWRDWIYAQGAFSAAIMILSIKAVAARRKFQI